MNTMTIRSAISLVDDADFAFECGEAESDPQLEGLKPELLRLALPVGFPIPEDDVTAAIIEPVLFFLIDRYLGPENRFVRNSVKAAADDLKDWWGYLKERKITWKDAARADVEEYRDIMGATVSPKTHEPYAEATIRRRVGTVLDYYEWADEQRLFDIKNAGLDARDIKRIRRAIDSAPLAHLHTATTASVSSILPRARRDLGSNVHPLLPDGWRQLAAELGPLPSDRSRDPRPSRDRLAGEVALNSGMRIDEVAGLTKHHITAITFDPSADPTSISWIWISRTKGGRPRRIYLPIWLIQELLTYIDGESKQTDRERKQAVSAGLARGGLKRDLGALFVNGTDAGRYAGRPIQTYTLDASFRAAVVRAGFIEHVAKTNPESGVTYFQNAPKHSFHDLRHTFAIWTYYKRRQDGDAEPWVFIQRILGHKSLSTTLGTYLGPSKEFETLVSDRFIRTFSVPTVA